MIIPINNGRTITPIYIPQVVRTNTGVIEQSDTNTQNDELSLGTWVMLGLVLIFLIAVVVWIIKLAKYLFGGEE